MRRRSNARARILGEVFADVSGFPSAFAVDQTKVAEPVSPLSPENTFSDWYAIFMDQQMKMREIVFVSLDDKQISKTGFRLLADPFQIARDLRFELVGYHRELVGRVKARPVA